MGHTDNLEFQVGDLAVYPAHGVGRIESIEVMEIGGEDMTFYIMNVLENGMVIMIPTCNVESVGLRRVIKEVDIPKVYEVMTKDLSFGERKLLDTAQSLLLKELCMAKQTDEKSMMQEIESLFSDEGITGPQAELA